jgi:hypothetical protein
VCKGSEESRSDSFICTGRRFGHAVDHEHHTRPKEHNTKPNMWPTCQLVAGDALCEDVGHVHRHACTECARKRAVRATMHVSRFVGKLVARHAILDQQSDTHGGGRAELTLGVLTPTR